MSDVFLAGIFAFVSVAARLMPARSTSRHVPHGVPPNKGEDYGRRALGQLLYVDADSAEKRRASMFLVRAITVGVGFGLPTL
jgi:hypothetical protein